MTQGDSVFSTSAIEISSSMTNLDSLLAAAIDPTTPAADLASLAKSSELEVQRGVAKNPNASETVLRSLWMRHPDCILENPLLTLWEFSKTECVAAKLGDDLALRLYNHIRDCNGPMPTGILNSATLKDVISKAASNLNPEVFKHVPREESASLRRLLVANASRYGMFRFFEQHAPDEIWLLYASDTDPDIRLDFANLMRSAPFNTTKTRAIAADALRLLVRDGRPEVIRHLANCRFLPTDLVEELSLSADVEVREALGRCFHSPQSALQRLAADPEEKVRVCLARHCADDEVQRQLLRDTSVNVRKQLAENTAIGMDLIREFDIQDDPAVVRCVFHRSDSEHRIRILRAAGSMLQTVLLELGPRLTPSFYSSVKSFIFPDILAKIPLSVGIAPKIIDDLAHDERPEIRLGVAKRLNQAKHLKPTKRNVELVNAFAKDASPRVRFQICADLRLDASSTAFLFKDPDPVLRKEALTAVLDFFVIERGARRFDSYRKVYIEKAPLIVSLAADSDFAVRFAIASCKEAPPAALDILSKDCEKILRDAVMAHTRWPFGVLIDLETRLGSKALAESLRHGHTIPGPEALRLLAKSTNPFERKMVAQCDRTCIRELKLLAQDSHPVVSETAHATLAKRKSKLR